MTLDDIIQARMERPFTRIGLANTLRDHDRHMSHTTAQMISNNAIDKAVREGLIKFDTDGGSAVFRRVT